MLTLLLVLLLPLVTKITSNVYVTLTVILRSLPEVWYFNPNLKQRKEFSSLGAAHVCKNTSNVTKCQLKMYNYNVRKIENRLLGFHQLLF